MGQSALHPAFVALNLLGLRSSFCFPVTAVLRSAAPPRYIFDSQHSTPAIQEALEVNKQTQRILIVRNRMHL